MRAIFFFVFVLASATVAFGSGPTTGDCILFDLTFWQKELHPSREQRSEISRINFDLHHTMYEMPATQPIDQEAIQMLLGVWRYSMYDVLSVRQKKKWKKIIARYYGAEQSSACK